MPPNVPTKRSRRLGRALRDLREQAGLEPKEVCALLRWSAAKISRLESGHTRPTTAIVKELLDLYRVRKDDPRWAALVDMAVAELEARSWWTAFDAPGPIYTRLVAFEWEADEVFVYEHQFVPGLLQTEDYARAVIAADDGFDDRQVTELVEVRMRRQALLDRVPVATLTAVIAEGVLRQQVGGPAVQRAQLQHLVAAAERDNVTVRVLPYSVGSLPARAGFTVLRYRDPDESGLGYAETDVGEIFVERPAELELLNRKFERLTDVALSGDESLALIAKVAAGM